MFEFSSLNKLSNNLLDVCLNSYVGAEKMEYEEVDGMNKIARLRKKITILQEERDDVKYEKSILDLETEKLKIDPNRKLEELLLDKSQKSNLLLKIIEKSKETGEQENQILIELKSLMSYYENASQKLMEAIKNQKHLEKQLESQRIVNFGKKKNQKKIKKKSKKNQKTKNKKIKK